MTMPLSPLAVACSAMPPSFFAGLKAPDGEIVLCTTGCVKALVGGPEIKNALSHLLGSVTPEAAKAVQFLTNVRIQEINANLYKASIAALHDDAAKPTALRLLGEREAYADINNFINRLKV